MRSSVLFFVYILIFGGCLNSTPNPELVALKGKTMGTTYSVKIVTARIETAQQKEQIRQRIDDELVRINKTFSTYDQESEISKFNEFGKINKSYKVSKDFYQLVDEAVQLYKETSGAYDIAIGPLSHLWGFGPKRDEGEEFKVPEDYEVHAAQARHTIKNLVLVPPDEFKKKVPELTLDVNSIAKGYGVDKIARRLKDNDFRHFMVEIGGEVVAHGLNLEGKPWRIGIELDRRMIVELRDKAIATSGDYRNYHMKDGQRFTHILDPRTGRPVKNELISVSVIAPNAMLADGLATAVMTLGPEEGLQFVEKRAGIETYMIMRDPAKKGGVKTIQSVGMKDWILQ